MTSKYQRPAGAFSGANGLANRTKYQDDANAVPKRAISSSKVDGDINYVIEALNTIDEASGVRASIHERLNVSLNADGTLKTSVAGALDEWIVHINPGVMTFVDGNTLKMAGDWRGVYQVNRRVKLTFTGQEMVGDIAGVTYADGLTTLVCIDMIDQNGYSALIGGVPTQIAYGPLTGGERGNAPRRFNGIKIPAGYDTYELVGAGSNLAIVRNGLSIVTVTESGIAGFATGSIGVNALNADASARLTPSGSVIAFAGATAPTGWLMCAGQTVSRFTYSTLFAAIGTTYGVGDGSTTFALPDLRGRSVFGLDNMGGTDSGRLSVANTLGLSGGAQTKSSTTASYTLTVADIPAHTHDANLIYGATVSGTASVGASYDTGTTGNRVVSKSIGGGGGHSHSITNFDVMPPYMLMNYIIKT